MRSGPPRDRTCDGPSSARPRARNASDFEGLGTRRPRAVAPRGAVRPGGPDPSPRRGTGRNQAGVAGGRAAPGRVTACRHWPLPRIRPGRGDPGPDSAKRDDGSQRSPGGSATGRRIADPADRRTSQVEELQAALEPEPVRPATNAPGRAEPPPCRRCGEAPTAEMMRAAGQARTAPPLPAAREPARDADRIARMAACKSWPHGRDLRRKGSPAIPARAAGLSPTDPGRVAAPPAGTALRRLGPRAGPDGTAHRPRPVTVSGSGSRALDP